MQEIETGQAFSKLKPELIVFIISVDEKEKPSGMIAARVMKCSRSSGLFAVTIGEKSYTHELIKQSQEFVVAMANKDLEPHIEVFGRMSGREVDKFAKTKIETLPARHIKSPLLKQASMNFECRVEKEVEVGECTMFIGKILAAHINEGKKMLFNYGKGYGDYLYKEL